MPGRDIIVVGASTGGVEALAQVIRGVPADLPAALFVVLHIPARGPSALPEILRRHGPLPAGHPVEGEAIRPGRIYVAPPDHHLLVRRGSVHLGRGPHENGHRPAVDPLFRSAARAYGRRAVGVVLSGALDDGAAGLAAVVARGGIGIAQDPTEALVASMPCAAIENVAVDHVVPATAIGPLLDRLAREVVPNGGEPMPEDLDAEVEIADLDRDALQSPDRRHGMVAEFGCPQCGGAFWEHEGGPLRFRCRVGHAWTAASLLDRQVQAQGDALWVAFRALKEATALVLRLAERAAGRDEAARARFAEEAQSFERRAEAVRRLICEGRSPTESGPGAAEAGPTDPGRGGPEGLI